MRKVYGLKTFELWILQILSPHSLTRILCIENIRNRSVGF